MRHLHHRRWILPAIALLTAAAAAPAHAQFGALRKAAERRVEQRAEDRLAAANLIAPTFDATTIEITTERLDRYTAAIEKVRAARAAARSRYEQMNTQRGLVVDSARALRDSPARTSYETARTRYSECRSDVGRAADADAERRNQELAARMQRDPIGGQNDPKVREFMTAMQAFATAQQSGDTAAIARAQQRLMTLAGGAGDSATLDRKAVPKCGARPVKPAVVVRQEALEARAESMRMEADALLASASAVKGAEVGMTDVQARMFGERIQSWLNGMRQDAVITRTFTQAEYDLLVGRRSALRRAFSGSE